MRSHSGSMRRDVRLQALDGSVGHIRATGDAEIDHFAYRLRLAGVINERPLDEDATVLELIFETSRPVALACWYLKGTEEARRHPVAEQIDSIIHRSCESGWGPIRCHNPGPRVAGGIDFSIRPSQSIPDESDVGGRCSKSHRCNTILLELIVWVTASVMGAHAFSVRSSNTNSVSALPV